MNKQNQLGGPSLIKEVQTTTLSIGFVSQLKIIKLFPEH